jgi:hypothetical protein
MGIVQLEARRQAESKTQPSDSAPAPVRSSIYAAVRMSIHAGRQTLQGR